MADLPKPLVHPSSTSSDEDLRKASAAHLAGSGPLQVIAELLSELRKHRFAWWTPEILRGWYGAGERMKWYEQRPDLRQHVTSTLTGLRPHTARVKAPEFQGQLIDESLAQKDCSVREFEEVFDIRDLTVYGPCADFWLKFRHAMPWTDQSEGHKQLLAWLLAALLGEKSGLDGMVRSPILTPWEVRSAIGVRVWHTRIPIDLHLAVDEARLKHEKEHPKEPFHTRHELAIVTPEKIAFNVPLKDLLPVLDAAEKAMGISASVTPSVMSTALVSMVTEPKVVEVDNKTSPSTPAPAPTAATDTPKPPVTTEAGADSKDAKDKDAKSSDVFAADGWKSDSAPVPAPANPSPTGKPEGLRDPKVPPPIPSGGRRFDPPPGGAARTSHPPIAPPPGRNPRGSGSNPPKGEKENRELTLLDEELSALNQSPMGHDAFGDDEPTGFKR